MNDGWIQGTGIAHAHSMTFLTGTLKIMEALLTLLVTPVLFQLEKVHPCISTPILLYYLVRQKKTWYVPKCSVWNAVYQKYQDAPLHPVAICTVQTKILCWLFWPTILCAAVDLSRCVTYTYTKPREHKYLTAHWQMTAHLTEWHTLQ